MQKEKNHVHGVNENLDKGQESGVKDTPLVYDVPVDHGWAWVILFSKYINVCISDNITQRPFSISIIGFVEPTVLIEQVTSNGPKLESLRYLYVWPPPTDSDSCWNLYVVWS